MSALTRWQLLSRGHLSGKPCKFNRSMQHHLTQTVSLKVVLMGQGKRADVSAAQRTEIWQRWKAGESLHEIGRAFGRTHTSIHLLLSHHGGSFRPSVGAHPKHSP
jgi:hypothetical protein